MALERKTRVLQLQKTPTFLENLDAIRPKLSYNKHETATTPLDNSRRKANVIIKVKELKTTTTPLEKKALKGRGRGMERGRGLRRREKGDITATTPLEKLEAKGQQ